MRKNKKKDQIKAVSTFLPPALWHRARIRCAYENIRRQDLFATALEYYLDNTEVKNG